MKYTKYLFMALLSAFLLAGCENDGYYYCDQPRIRLLGEEIWTLGTDSLLFSFVAYGTDVTTMAMNVEAWVMGETAGHDRTLRLEVDKERTTASADLYEFPETVTVPADANKVMFPVVLKRVAALKSGTVGLCLKVAASDDFAVGVGEQDHLLLKWNDILSRPTNWDELEEYFGTYSDTKYRFMLANAPGVTEFSTETMNWAQLMNYRIKFTSALNEYNAEHPGGPLSENGVLIDFTN